MVSLPQVNGGNERESGGCGASCGAGLEKIYPTTAVRFGAMNWIGEFTYEPGTVFKCGAKVVIQTDRGMELGKQVSLTCNGCPSSVSREQITSYVQASGPEFYRLNGGHILREATARDISEQEHLNAHVQEDMETCALLAAKIGLDMKIVLAEHLLGGERIVFYFRSEQRVDFRSLVKELARRYHTRIEMRQVQPREEARLVADHEICGRECCCKNFLKKMRPVNMKMAKLQKSTLDPSKVSGRCGRLRCCLRYEHEGYEQLAAKLPNVGARVGTDHGEADVMDRQILTQLLLLRFDDNRELTVPLEEIRAFDLPPRAPAADAAVRPRDSADEPDARHMRRFGANLRRASDAAGDEAPPGTDAAPASERERRGPDRRRRPGPFRHDKPPRRDPGSASDESRGDAGAGDGTPDDSQC